MALGYVGEQVPIKDRVQDARVNIYTESGDRVTAYDVVIACVAGAAELTSVIYRSLSLDPARRPASRAASLRQQRRLRREQRSPVAHLGRHDPVLDRRVGGQQGLRFGHVLGLEDGQARALRLHRRPAGHDHALHAVVPGPGGKWYVNHGNIGADVTMADGRQVHASSYYSQNPQSIGKKSFDGRLYVGGFGLRMNPDGSGAEELCEGIFAVYGTVR